ncbi:MAG: ABC transporter ATP-binding protein, partial [Chloroflexi bacterium]|nr:ABC transporter ATP-binding protein [Chloroflexota bacterium]
MATLEVRGLSVHRRDDGVFLDGISLTLESGRFGAIFGPDDAGKISLLRAIAGLLPLAEGEVLLNGGNVTSWRPEQRGIGMVFRDPALFEGRTVRDNVAFGLRASGHPRQQRARRVAEVLQLLNLYELLNVRVERLSRLEQARVAIARAIAPEPLVLLLDEPTAGLAAADRVAFRDDIRGLLDDLNITTLIATSDLDDAFAMADELVVLNGGRVLQSGPLWRVLHGPVSVRAAELFGYVMLIQGDTRDGRIVEPGVGTLEFPEGFPLGPRAMALAHPSSVLGVPPESGLGSGVEGTIGRVRAYGPTWVLDLELADRILEVRWEWDRVPPSRGQRVAVAVRPDTVRFFNEGDEILRRRHLPRAARVSEPVAAEPERDESARDAPLDAPEPPEAAPEPRDAERSPW